MEPPRFETVVLADLDDFGTGLAQRPGTSEVWISTKQGRLLGIDLDRAPRTDDGLLAGPPPEGPVELLDLSDETDPAGEGGMLDVAFGPEGDVVYLSHTTTAGDLRVVRYRIAASGPVGPGHTVASVPGRSTLHHSGAMVTTPDGSLLLGVGDGGWVSRREAADPSSPRGKILRVSPKGLATDPYEVVARGVRNPWKLSVDGADNTLWFGDVGERSREEVNVVDLGRAQSVVDLGWPAFEGTQATARGGDLAGLDPFSEAFGDPSSPSSARNSEVVWPVAEYLHRSDACAVVGGFVYRGAALEDLTDSYLYGDFCSTRLMRLPAGKGAVPVSMPTVFGHPPTALAAFDRENVLALSTGQQMVSLVATVPR